MFPLMCELVLGLIIDGGNRNMTQNGYFGGNIPAYMS